MLVVLVLVSVLSPVHESFSESGIWNLESENLESRPPAVGGVMIENLELNFQVDSFRIYPQSTASTRGFAGGRSRLWYLKIEIPDSRFQI